MYFEEFVVVLGLAHFDSQEGIRGNSVVLAHSCTFNLW